MGTYNIEIPEKDLESLSELLNVEDHTLEKVADYIASTSITEELKEVEKAISDITKHYSFIFALIYTYCQIDWPAVKFINELYEYYISKSKAPVSKDFFIEKLSVIIKEGLTLKFNIKSKVLQSENQKNFYSSRIFTDIRPVFSNNDEEELIGKVILNQLKITYGEDNQKKEFFITLDSNDLNQLKQTIERAERKIKVLESKIIN